MRRISIFIYVYLIASALFAEEIVTRKDGTQVVLYDDHTWAEVSLTNTSSAEIISKNKKYLREGITASDEQIAIACEMYEQGWIYTMPRPKSAKAAWGVSDGRTTWYNGWWYNSKTNLYSDTTPRLRESGMYLGDNQNNSYTWRNGGTPRRPDIFMYLLSKDGGPR